MINAISRTETNETPEPPSSFELAAGFVTGRPGPEIRLRLKQELLFI